MRRAADLLFRNWPIKLGAIFLATVLYSGLVLGQNVRIWTGEVPIEPIRPPTDATLLSDLQPVTLIRYRAPLDVGVLSPASFRATVDLSSVAISQGGPPAELPVFVDALDQRVQVVDYQPQVLTVQLDPIDERQMQVTVDTGAVPAGLHVATPQTEPSSVSIRGAASRIATVVEVEARVTIDASALNIDREVDLLPVDANGNQVPNVEVDPERARVRIAVARELANRTLPVVAQLTGQPAPGHRIASITVEPLVVTVSGEEAIVTQLETAMTDPIDVIGRTTDLEATTGFELPAGVSISGGDRVTIRISIIQETGSRTFTAGVTTSGASADLTYAIATSDVAVTLGGPLATLDQLDASTLAVTADVSGIGAGSHLVDLSLEPPVGLQLVAISPAQVAIEIAPAPAVSPTPDGI